MDHFYTAVEERERPEIKGNPVIVGSDPKEGKGRGVVSTSNYEARKSGVRSGMPISMAWRLCPRAVYLPPNFPLYTSVSGEIMLIARKYTGKFEQWGIDEAFLDVSDKVADWGEAEALAQRIKEEIKEKEGITASPSGWDPTSSSPKLPVTFRSPTA
jgi:DNA polymerase IV (DinB-like DNA polymerase)